MIGPQESIVELSDERLQEELAAAKDRVARIARGGRDEASATSARRLLGQLEFEATCRGLMPAAEPAGAQ
jgi:hypothetical protein